MQSRRNYFGQLILIYPQQHINIYKKGCGFMALKNEIGNRYGKLLVLERAVGKNNNEAYWKCQCDCGNIIITRGSSLRAGKTTSCGKCLRSDVIDETGNRYGKLLVLKKSDNLRTNSLTGAVWTCQCDCGAILDICGTVLRRKNGPKSCRSCSQKINLIGKKFDLLTVIGELPNNNYKCKCDCGNEIIVNARELLRGHRKSCGCLTSIGEKEIITILNMENINYETQKSFNNCRNSLTKCLFRFDFYLPSYNTLIEYDGEQHFIGWSRDLENLKKNQERDNFKNKWCKENNIHLIRIPYWHLNKICLEDLLPETSKFIIS